MNKYNIRSFALLFLSLLQIGYIICILLTKNAFHNDMFYINTTLGILIFQGIINLQHYMIFYNYNIIRKEMLPSIYFNNILIINYVLITILLCIEIVCMSKKCKNDNIIYLPSSIFSLLLIRTTQNFNKNYNYDEQILSINNINNDINNNMNNNNDNQI